MTLVWLGNRWIFHFGHPVSCWSGQNWIYQQSKWNFVQCHFVALWCWWQQSYDRTSGEVQIYKSDRAEWTEHRILSHHYWKIQPTKSTPWFYSSCFMGYTAEVYESRWFNCHGSRIFWNQTWANLYWTRTDHRQFNNLRMLLSEQRCYDSISHQLWTLVLRPMHWTGSQYTQSLL